MPENCGTAECPIEPRVAALERANEQHRRTHRDMYERLNKLDTENAVQNTRYDAIIEKLDGLKESHDNLGAKLGALEAKPGKRWEGIADKAIWAVCAAVIAFLLAKMGLPV